MAITSTPNSAALNLVNAASHGKSSSKSNEGNEAGLASLDNTIGGTNGLKNEDAADASANKTSDDKKLSFGDLLLQQMQPTAIAPSITAETPAAIATDTPAGQVPDSNLVNLALQQMGVQLNPTATQTPPLNPLNPSASTDTQSASSVSLNATNNVLQNSVQPLQSATDMANARPTAPTKAPPLVNTENNLTSAASASTPPIETPVASTNNFATALSQARQEPAALVIDATHSAETEIKPAQASSAAPTMTPLATPMFEKTADNGMHLGSIQANIHSPQFANEAAERVKFAIGNNIQSAQIDIHPADLGPISINLHMQGQHSASINFSAAQPETRQALENALPRLRELLADAGIQLSDAQVGQQSFAQAQEQSFQSAKTNFASREITGVEEAPRTVTLPLNRQGDASGLLDLYA